MNIEVGNAPEPGIYEDVPFEQYLNWPYTSNSSLHAATRSMLHYRCQQPMNETPALRFGTLCHLGRLEPSAVFKRYIVMPDLTAGITTADGKPAASPKSTKEYKERVKAWEAMHAVNKIIVSQEEFENMTGVVSALDSHEIAHDWFTAEGPAEVSIVWDDYQTETRCKGRLDKFSLSRGLIADLKTTRDCLMFPSQLAARGYHRQGAMYIDGIAKLTGEVCRFGIVAVENVKPFGVMAAPVRESDIELGREEYTGILRQIADSRAAKRWPGYTSPAEWTLPAWRTNSETELLELTFAGEPLNL